MATDNSIYRREALEYSQTKTWDSKVLLLTPVSGKVYLLVSLLLTGLLLAWLFFGTFTRRIEVHGELVLSPHPVQLNSPKAGYISEIYVTTGQQVTKEQPLFKIRLMRTTNSGDVGDNSRMLISNEISHTDMIIANLQKNKQITLDSITSQIDRNKQILEDIAGRLAEIDSSVKELSQLIHGYKTLQRKGMATKNELITQQLNYFQQKSLYQNFYARDLQQKITIATLESELKTRASQFDSEILQQQIQKSGLQVKLMEVEAVSEFIVNAPMAGNVEATSVTIGQTAHEGTALAQITPTGQTNYQLVFWVPNEAIVWLKPQQTIKVRYDAFPWEKFGQFAEKIETISTTPASAQEISFYKNSQINPDPNNPLYKVVATVQRTRVSYDNKHLQVTDGMRTSVTVFLERRPLYQWVFMPLYSLQKNLTAPVTEGI